MNSNISEVDHKILSDLVYLDIYGDSELEKLYSRGKLTIGKLANKYKERPEDLEKLRDRFNSDAEFETFKQTTLEVSKESSKYYDWKISHVVDHNSETGFVAYTFEPKDGEAVAAFRGSEDMTKLEHLNTDWLNNGSSIYEYLTMQQRESRKYINEVGKDYDIISTTGHSLGGNDALSAAVLANSNIRGKIWAVRTFNAPGFNKEFLETNGDSIKEIELRIQEFQNTNDIVSSLFYNLTKPIIIETNTNESKGLKSLMDPFIILNDSHALRHLSQENDGRLRRTESQQKNFACLFVSNLTQGAQMLPNKFLEGAVDTVFAVLNGRINLKDVLNAGLVIASLEPAAAVLIGVIASELVIKAVVTIFVVTLTVTVMEFAYSTAHEMISKLHDQVVEYMNQLFVEMVIDGLIFNIKINEYKQKLIEEVVSFFVGVAQLSKSLCEWWDSLGRNSFPDERILVDTDELRNIATRLTRIQNRIYDVDAMLNFLTRSVEIEDKLIVMGIDRFVGTDYRLKNCIKYLQNAAEEFEHCEREVLGKARELVIG